MQDSSIDSKIEILDKLINMGEIQDAPFHGKVVSIPRINAKKPHSEFLCVEKVRQTATIPKKNGNVYLFAQEQERLTFVPGETYTIDFYIKIKFPSGYYGLFLSNEKFAVIDPIMLNYMPVSTQVKIIAKQEFVTMKSDILLKMVLLPIVNTEVKEVLRVSDI